jgi:hypothetical protein
MWIAHVTLPLGLRFSVTPQRVWGAVGAFGVMVLLALYVAVLQHGVARGERMRAEQRAGITTTAEKMAKLKPAERRPDKVAYYAVTPAR